MNLLQNVCKKTIRSNKEVTQDVKVDKMESGHHPHKRTMGSVHTSHQLLTSLRKHAYVIYCNFSHL